VLKILTFITQFHNKPNNHHEIQIYIISRCRRREAEAEEEDEEAEIEYEIFKGPETLKHTSTNQ
jgi:hypothetical protein